MKYPKKIKTKINQCKEVIDCYNNLKEYKKQTMRKLQCTFAKEKYNGSFIALLIQNKRLHICKKY